MTASLSRQALIQQTLADEGWCCDPYGHEDGPPAVGECSDCDRLRGDTARAVLAALDAPQGGDEARLTEAERERGIVCTAENGAEIRLYPDYTVEEFIAARFAAPRDQAGDALADRVRALADEWQTNANALLKQGVIERSVRSTMVGCADALRALLDQPDATASDSLVERLRAQREWSTETFGPGDRYRAILDHLHKELLEVRREPRDVEEWIDVVILAFDGAWRTGATPEQVVAALDAKYAKNRARNWPDWRTADPDKAIEHVPDATASEEDQR